MAFSDSQNNFEKDEQKQEDSYFQVSKLMQSNSNQDSNKDRHRYQWWNWESGNKLMYLRSTNFWQWCRHNPMAEGQSFQQRMLGQLDNQMQKNDVASYHILFTKINSQKTTWGKNEVVRTSDMAMISELWHQRTNRQTDSSELKTFVYQKKWSKKWRDNPQNGRKYLWNIHWTGSSIQNT